jgi:Ca2+-transporting ATPase
MWPRSPGPRRRWSGFERRRGGEPTPELRPNRLASAKKESALQAFLRQYEDFMQIILLGAAIVNALVTDDFATTVLLAGLTVFNAIIGLRQEAKAEASVEALAQMMKTIARVRRDGQAIEIDAESSSPATSCWWRLATACPPTGGSASRRRSRSRRRR